MAVPFTAGDVQQAYSPNLGGLASALQQYQQNSLLAAQRQLQLKRQQEEDQYKKVELANQLYPWDDVASGTELDPLLRANSLRQHQDVTKFLLSNPNLSPAAEYDYVMGAVGKSKAISNMVARRKADLDTQLALRAKERPWEDAGLVRNQVYHTAFTKDGQPTLDFDPSVDAFAQFKNPALASQVINPTEFSKAQATAFGQLFPMPAEDAVIQAGANGKQFRDAAGNAVGVAYRAPTGFSYTGNGTNHSFAPDSQPIQVGSATLPSLAPQLYNRIAGNPLFDIPISQRVQTLAQQNADFAALPPAQQQSIAAYQVASELPGKVGASAKLNYDQQKYNRELQNDAFSHQLQQENLAISRANLGLAQQREAREQKKAANQANNPAYFNTPQTVKWANTPLTSATSKEDAAKIAASKQILNTHSQIYNIGGQQYRLTNLNAPGSDFLRDNTTREPINYLQGRDASGKPVTILQYTNQSTTDPYSPFQPTGKVKIYSSDGVTTYDPMNNGGVPTFHKQKVNQDALFRTYESQFKSPRDRTGYEPTDLQ